MFSSFLFSLLRFAGEWMHQCGNHNHWTKIWNAFNANGPHSIGLWYGIVCVLGASDVFWWSKKCIKTTLDWYRYAFDGFGFNGLFITAFFGWLIQSNKCRGQCLSNGKNRYKYGELEIVFFIRNKENQSFLRYLSIVNKVEKTKFHLFHTLIQYKTGCSWKWWKNWGRTQKTETRVNMVENWENEGVQYHCKLETFSRLKS